MGEFQIGGEIIGVTSKRLNVNAGTVELTAYTAPKFGELIAGTAAAICGTVAARYVAFKAHPSNAGTVYVGVSGVTVPDGTADATSGWPLTAGQDTPLFQVDNLNRFYMIANAASQRVAYVVVS